MDIFNSSGRKVGAIEEGEPFGGCLTLVLFIVVVAVGLTIAVAIDGERRKHIKTLTNQELKQRDSANKSYERKVKKEIEQVQKQHPEWDKKLKKWEKRWEHEKKQK